jgi:ubiquinone/menaquinone biosynthesis C-methylase UbiE
MILSEISNQNKFMKVTEGKLEEMINYDTHKYLQYMELPVVDEAKKSLELQLVSDIICNLPINSAVLDIGTATARYPLFFAGLGFDVVGIDICEDGLSLARKNVNSAKLDHRIKLYEMDATSIQFSDESFNLVTCMMGTICHLSTSNKSKVFKEIWRVLKPGGTVIITSWDPECTYTNYLSFYTEMERDLLRLNSLSAKELVNLLNINGFSDVKNQTITHFSDGQLMQLGLENGFSKLEKAQRYINSHFPELQGQLYAVHGCK